MIEFETGNILDEKYPIFCHQVNCKGKMGAGLARQIREKYPEVYKDYKEYCEQGLAKLGDILPIPTNDGRICINMFAQYGYGRDSLKTDYNAFSKCLMDLRRRCNNARADVTIAFPYRIGCGLAGGDWDIILPLLEQFEENVIQKIIIVSKE